MLHLKIESTVCANIWSQTKTATLNHYFVDKNLSPPKIKSHFVACDTYLSTMETVSSISAPAFFRLEAVLESEMRGREGPGANTLTPEVSGTTRLPPVVKSPSLLLDSGLGVRMRQVNFSRVHSSSLSKVGASLEP